jgi:pectate lyase
MKNKNVYMGIGGIILAVLVFFCGMKYGQTKSVASLQNRGGQFAQMGGFTGARGGIRGATGGVINGDILAMDATSITVQVRNPGTSTTQGGSKIVFYTNTTVVTKTVSGTTADLAVGKQVTITGTPNADGSISADSVQIRPTPVK